MSIAVPLVGAWFGIEFQGQITCAFRECTGLGRESEVVEYKATGEKGEYIISKVPGRRRWNHILLRRSITDTMEIWKWRNLVEEVRCEEARKNGSIVMFDSSGAEIARWNFMNAWPSKLTGPSPQGGQATALKELEITHEGLERVNSG